MKNGKAENTKADIGKRIKDIRKDRPQMDLAKLAFKNSSSENSAQGCRIINFSDIMKDRKAIK